MTKPPLNEAPDGLAHYIASPTEDQTKAPLEWVEEKTHFFELSKFSDALQELYAARPEMLKPDSRRNEVLSFIRQELRDTSISREMDWGIPVPSSVPESRKSRDLCVV